MDSPTPRRAKLPPELILYVVDCVAPAHPDALVPASHASTKTLLALTRVSRLTYSRASQLLRRRCVYIDSGPRLASLLLCIPRLVPTLRPTLSLRNMTSLFLAPFGASLDDQPTAMWVRELLCEVGETLRRLVVQMPFASLDAHDDHLSVRRILRQGFEQLARVEEFVCVGDYPQLSVDDGHGQSHGHGQTDIWRLWPELRRLALFGVPLDSHWLWWDIATLRHLSQVVLARPSRLDLANIKDQYFHMLPADDERLRRELRVMLLDTAYAMGDVDTRRWHDIDPHGRMTVETYPVPTPFYGDETPTELVTQWVKRGALAGTLWEWKGDKVVGVAGGEVRSEAS